MQRMAEYARAGQAPDDDTALQVAGETAQARESQAREQAAGRVESTATEQAASVKGEYKQKPVEERTFSYDELTKKPDMKVITLDMDEIIDRKDARVAGINDAKQKAERFDNNGAPMIWVDDLGKYVIIGRHGLEHGMGSDSYDQNVAVKNIVDVLKNSVVTLSADVNDPGIKKRWTLFSVVNGMKGPGDVYLVRMQVDQSTGHLEDVSSIHAVRTKKDGASQNAAPYAWQNSLGSNGVLGSTISIADMLAIVKNVFPESVSLDVASKLGFKRVVKDKDVHPDYSLKILPNQPKFSMKQPVERKGDLVETSPNFV